MPWVERRRVRLRDAGSALGLYLLLLATRPVTVLPLRPWFLLDYWFDAARYRLAPGLASPLLELAFALYLVVLALVAARIATRLRERFGPAGAWRFGVAGGLLTLVLLGTANLALEVALPVGLGRSPLLVAAATGLAGLWVGWRLGAATSGTA